MRKTFAPHSKTRERAFPQAKLVYAEVLHAQSLCSPQQNMRTCLAPKRSSSFVHRATCKRAGARSLKGPFVAARFFSQLPLASSAASPVSAPARLNLASSASFHGFFSHLASSASYLNYHTALRACICRASAAYSKTCKRTLPEAQQLFFSPRNELAGVLVHPLLGKGPFAAAHVGAVKHSLSCLIESLVLVR